MCFLFLSISEEGVKEGEGILGHLGPNGDGCGVLASVHGDEHLSLSTLWGASCHSQLPGCNRRQEPSEL